VQLVKRRALEAGLPSATCCHTFRATGITAYLENGGTLENAAAIAAHESPRGQRSSTTARAMRIRLMTQRIAISDSSLGSVHVILPMHSAAPAPSWFAAFAPRDQCRAEGRMEVLGRRDN
jgi:hypothetical protein